MKPNVDPDLYPDLAYEQMVAWEADCQEWDFWCPEWQEMSLDPEDRRFVDYRDVENPEEYVIRPVQNWTVVGGAYGDGLFV